MRNTIANVLVVIAVLTGIMGIFNFSLQHQLLNSYLYTQALKESGIYPTTTSIVSESVSTGLISLQKNLIDTLVVTNLETETSFTNRIVFTLINTLIDTQTPKLVDSLMERIKFEKNVEEYATQAINSSTAWLNGDVEAGELFNRIPTPEQVAAFRQASLSQLLYQLTSNQVGEKTLPFCTTAADVQTNLQRAVQGDFESISCTNNQIQPLLDAFFSSPVAIQALDNAESQIQTKLETSGITKIIDGLYQVVLTVTELKQSALELRSLLRLNERITYGLIATAVTTLLIAVMLKTSKRLKLIIKSLFAVGITVLAISLLYSAVISEIILYQLAITKLTTFSSFLTNSQNLSLLDSLNRIVGYILQHLMDLSMYIGLGLTIISGTLWIMHDLITSPKVQQSVLSFSKTLQQAMKNLVNSIQTKWHNLISKPKTDSKPAKSTPTPTKTTSTKKA